MRWRSPDLMRGSAWSTSRAAFRSRPAGRRPSGRSRGSSKMPGRFSGPGGRPPPPRPRPTGGRGGGGGEEGRRGTARPAGLPGGVPVGARFRGDEGLPSRGGRQRGGDSSGGGRLVSPAASEGGGEAGIRHPSRRISLPARRTPRPGEEDPRRDRGVSRAAREGGRGGGSASRRAETPRGRCSRGGYLRRPGSPREDARPVFRGGRGAWPLGVRILRPRPPGGDGRRGARDRSPRRLLGGNGPPRGGRGGVCAGKPCGARRGDGADPEGRRCKGADCEGGEKGRGAVHVGEVHGVVGATSFVRRHARKSAMNSSSSRLASSSVICTAGCFM